MAQTILSNTARDLHRLCQELLGGRRLILASHRGPVEYHRDEEGRWKVRRGRGGVVTALIGVARFANLAWVSSPNTQGELAMACPSANGCLSLHEEGSDIRLRFAIAPSSAYDKHYNLISNPILWFLQHSLWDQLERPNLWEEVQEGWHRGYLPVNHAFARSVLAELAMADTSPYVMFHDYHLYIAPLYVRARAPTAILSHFIHIPWPGPDAWQQLPAPIVGAICRGLLANDIVGFQTRTFAHNFLLTCRSFLQGVEVDWEGWAIRYRGRLTRVRPYPVSVDVEDLRRRMASPEVKAYKERLAPLCGPQTIVRVDRLDPSKNVLAGFQAFDLLLRRHPELVGRVKFLAFLVPSRTAIPEYRSYAHSTFRLVEEINRTYGRDGWRPIEVFYENNYSQALAGLSMYDALLTNSLADGMNLVAKEGPIVNERDGVLILSRNAGSYQELGEAALAIDPRQIGETAEALAMALSLPLAERRARARRLRAIIQERDLGLWLTSQLEDLGSLPASPSK